MSPPIHRHPVTREEMIEAKIPLEYRDSCADILVPLNRCRRSTNFMPWKCQDLRHAYEKCQYEQFLERKKRYEDEMKKE